MAAGADAAAAGAVSDPVTALPRADGPLTALRDTLAVGFGLVPLGLAFGLLLTQSGFAWWWAPLFSLLIYAGSLEFLAIGLLLALTPLAELAVTTLLVNSRHVFYALSFPLHRLRGPWAKTYGMYALTDEVYAVTAAKDPEELTGRRILWIQVLCQLYWVGGGVLGALAGAALPGRIRGVEFALTALFAVLAIDAIRQRRGVPTPVLALVCALIGLLVLPDQMLMVAMPALVAALIVRYLLRRRRLDAAGPAGQAAP